MYSIIIYIKAVEGHSKRGKPWFYCSAKLFPKSVPFAGDNNPECSQLLDLLGKEDPD